MLKMKRAHLRDSAIHSGIAALLMLILTVLPGVQTANAQVAFGTVVGNVIDPSGAVVSGATVTLKSNETGQMHTMKTTSAGTYSFVNLDPGTYSIRVEQTGFKTLEQTGASLKLEVQPARISRSRLET